MPQAVERSDLARRIRAAQELADKRTQDLADALGWNISKLLRMKRGDQTPTAIELSQIAAATGVPIGFFFGASSDVDGTDGAASLSDPQRKSKATASSSKKTAAASN